jgi:hypothetical protein
VMTRVKGHVGDEPTGGFGLTERLTSFAMRQTSRRGMFGWLGRAGVAVVASSAIAGTAFSLTPATTALALGCPECWGSCDPCNSTCCCPCSTRCSCTCTKGCYGCQPVWAQAHLHWFLGYIPLCDCPGC